MIKFFLGFFSGWTIKQIIKWFIGIVLFCYLVVEFGEAYKDATAKYILALGDQHVCKNLKGRSLLLGSCEEVFKILNKSPFWSAFSELTRRLISSITIIIQNILNSWFFMSIGALCLSYIIFRISATAHQYYDKKQFENLKNNEILPPNATFIALGNSNPNNQFAYTSPFQNQNETPALIYTQEKN